MNIEDLLNQVKSDKTVFNLGDLVYLRTDPEQLERIVVAICIRGIGLSYELACGPHGSWHYGIEITYTKDIKKATNG